MLLGTPAYMSPEQIKSARDVDARADLWSAGVMFYEMLTGRVAFPAPTEFARLAAVLSTEPEPIERIDASLAPLSAFVTRALAKSRDDRWSTALDMARALVAAAPHAANAPADGRAHALSRLPDVASLFAPQIGAVPSTAPMGAGAAPAQAQGSTAPDKAPGGTLASASPGRPVTDPPPHVMVISSATGGGETLPSKDLPIIGRGAGRGRGVAPALVVILVAVALVAGFLLGWSVGHMP
jgi:serine/threonine-protein kinase